MRMHCRLADLLQFLLPTMILLACASPADPRPPSPTFTLTARPTDLPPSPTPSPTRKPTRTPARTPTPTATPNPLAPYTIDALATRSYGESDILVREVLESDGPYYRYVIEYLSDGLTVTGLMNVPYGDGPFPVIVVLHGYTAPETYYRGFDSRPLADTYALNGYAAIMPDYRGHMGTAGGPDPLRIPYVIDVMNLVAALDTLDILDADRVGLIGHSMGGGIATYVMVLSERVDAVVLYASMSADQAVNWHYIGQKWAPYWMNKIAELYGSPTTNPEGYAQISPISYLDRVKAAVQIHHGTADTEVPVEWSRALAEQMEQAGIALSYYEYPNAPHTFTGPTFWEMAERTLDFFDTYVAELD